MRDEHRSVPACAKRAQSDRHAGTLDLNAHLQHSDPFVRGESAMAIGWMAARPFGRPFLTQVVRGPRLVPLSNAIADDNSSARKKKPSEDDVWQGDSETITPQTPLRTFDNRGQLPVLRRAGARPHWPECRRRSTRPARSGSHRTGTTSTARATSRSTHPRPVSRRAPCHSA